MPLCFSAQVTAPKCSQSWLGSLETHTSRFDTQVARAVGKLVAASPSPEIAELARHIAADRGTDLPEMLLIGLAQQEHSTSDVGVEIAQQLSGSLSARVRHRAKRILNRQSSQPTTPS